MPARELGLEETRGDGVDLRAREVDELRVVLTGERFGERTRGDPSATEQDLAEPPAVLLLLIESGLELLARQVTRLDQELTEQRAFGRSRDGQCGRGFHGRCIGHTRPGLRAVVQRVSRAKVTPGGEIGAGLCVLLGVADTDDDEAADRLAGKVARLRIFENDEGKFDRSLLDVGGKALVVSQFTLIADTAKGNRPSFVAAARPEVAEPLYERFCRALEEQGVGVARGTFGTRMAVELVNDGPVTIVLDS